MATKKLPHKIETRLINAPTEVVWESLTNKTFLEKWWWLKPATGFISSLDVRPGGLFHYEINNTEPTINADFIFIEVIKNQRLVITNALTRELKPTLSAVPETIIFQLKPKGTSTELSIDVLTRDFDSLQWLWENHYLAAWYYCLDTMQVIAEQFTQMRSPSPTPPAQP